jgi:uridine kinase
LLYPEVPKNKVTVEWNTKTLIITMNIDLHHKAVIQSLTGMILEISCPHPLRVAIDGVDAAGKTTLAEELALSLQSQPRQVIRRLAGDLSPEGFYRDSYHYKALIENLLAPFGPDRNRRYRTTVFDVRTDRPVDPPIQTAAADAILLMVRSTHA